jgi:pyruvate/2-oxoglutarate dehydrogenase complex dihydrolipoamide acyltransferase (E2) component
MKPDLKKALEDALNEKVKVKKGDKEVVLTKAIVGIQHLVNQFAKGDRHARRDVFQYAELLGVDLQGKELVVEMLGASDQAIVDAFLRRQEQPSVPAPADTHVKAPPDLLDDDAAKAEAVATSAAPPQPDKPAKPAPEQVLDENGKPLPVSDIIRAMRERHLAQQKKNQGG